MATAQESTRGLAKVLEGTVKSNKMDKTIVVSVSVKKRHPRFKKFVTWSKSYKAHDAENQCQIGDRVRIVECRPLSKDKRWRLQAVVEKAV